MPLLLKSAGKWSVGILLAALCGAALRAEAAPGDKARWDGKYSTEAYIFGKQPIPFLAENAHLLPKGRAADLAMGEGRNGVYLATQGWQVVGLDISEEGFKKARKLAEENKVKIETRAADLENYELEKDAYDVVICAYYLQRSLFPRIKEALKSGGMAVIETYNIDHLRHAAFNKDWLLGANELLEVFKDFKIIRYQYVDNGKEAFSSIIAQKP